MKVKFDFSDVESFQHVARRALRRDKQLMNAIYEALSLADRAGNSECRTLLARALREA